MWIASYGEEYDDLLRRSSEADGGDPAEDLVIIVQSDIRDWDSDGPGATAGYIPFDTPVEILERRLYEPLAYGERQKAVEFIRIRGAGIEGWVTAHSIQEVPDP